MSTNQLREAAAVALALTLAGWTTAYSAPASSSAVRFSVNGDEFTLPMPDGMCVPPAALSGKVQSLSGMLDQSQMSFGAALLRCDLKSLAQGTPLAVLVAGSSKLTEKIPGSRTTILKQISAELRSQDGQQRMKAGLAQAGSLESNATGVPTEVSGKPTLVDEDEYAAYVFTNLQMKGGTNVAGAVMEAVTVVKGRLILLVVISAPGTMDDAKALLALTKAEAKRFVGANDEASG